MLRNLCSRFNSGVRRPLFSVTPKLLASLLVFVFLASPLGIAFASEPEQEVREDSVHLLLIHILVDEYGGVLGIAPFPDDFFLWAYAPANTLTGNGSPVFSTDVPYTGDVAVSVPDSYAYSETNYANPHAPTQYGTGTATSTYLYDSNGNITVATGTASTTFTWDYRKIGAD